MKNSKYLIVGICFLFFLLAAVFLSKKSTPPPGSLSFANQEDILSQKMWSKLPFAPISDTEQLRSYLAGIAIDGEQLLSSAQKRELIHSLSLLLRAFNMGTYEAYIAFRIPKDSEYEYSSFPMEIAASEWIKLHSKNAKLPSNDELLHWRLTHLEGENRICKKGAWEGICIDSKIIYQTIGRTNYMKEAKPKAGIFASHCSNTDTTDPFDIDVTYNSDGVSTYEPSINFKFSTDTFTQLKAFSYFFVKLSTKRVLPIYIEHTWDEKSKQWIPTRLASGVNEAWRSEVRYISF